MMMMTKMMILDKGSTILDIIDDMTVGAGDDESGLQTVSPQLIINPKLGGRLPLLSPGPAITFSDAEYHRRLASIK